MSENNKPLVLLRWRDRGDDSNPEDVEVDSVHQTEDEVVARIAAIEKANPPYKAERTLGWLKWTIGPDEDESAGFFGVKPMVFFARKPRR